MNLVRSSYPQHGVVHPDAEVRAGGWHSTIGTLTKYGWQIEFSQDATRDAVVVYFRNPTNNMVAYQALKGQMVQRYHGTFPPLIYLDEQVLIEVDLHRRVEAPKLEIFTMGVGVAMQPINTMNGSDHEWHMYTADKQETEIIVTLEKVPMLLEEIRKAQAPRAKELVHAKRKRDYRELETKATILAFG